MAKNVAKLNGKEIPYKDIIKIQMCFVSDTTFYEVTYRQTEPMYAEIKVLLPEDKGYALEKKVRKCCSK